MAKFRRKALSSAEYKRRQVQKERDLDHQWRNTRKTINGPQTNSKQETQKKPHGFKQAN